MNEFNKEVKNSIEILKQGKILLYPTDTIWGLGCDASNFTAIKNIYAIKKRCLSKPMIILVDTIKRLYELVGIIPNHIKKIILQSKIKKPVTVIYKLYNKTYSFLVNSDNTLAIRLTYDPFCICIIKHLNKPIISTSANISGDLSPMSFLNINPIILNKVDYAVNIRRENISIYNNSKIVKFDKKNINILRK